MSAVKTFRAEGGRLLSVFVDMVEAVRARARLQARLIAIEGDDGRFSVVRVSAGQPVPIGEVDAWSEPQRTKFAKDMRGGVELRLASETMVATVLKVPAEALPFVREVIEHRLEKLTPWRPEKLIYGYDVAAKPGADNHYDVHFSATSREIARAAEARLRQSLGVAASAIGSAAEPLDKPLRIDLLGGSGDALGSRRRGRIAAIALAVVAGTCAFFVWSQWVAADAARSRTEVDARLAAIRQRLVTGSAIDPARRRDEALIRSKTPDASVFLLIDRLANAIPDDTVLDELDIKPDSVRVAGTSSDASSLVDVLETKMSLTDAEFAAPVTRQPDGRDRFDIVLSRKRLPEGSPVP